MSGRRGGALFVLLPGLAVAAGCASASAIPLGEQRYPPRPDDHEIVVYDALEDVPRDYVKVSRIVGTGSSSASWDRVVAVMKARAREAGGDALVLGREQSAIETDADGCVSSEKLQSALAIRWRDS